MMSKNQISEDKARKIISKNTRYLLESNSNMSQKALAELLAISPAQISNIIKETQTPTLYPFLTGIREQFKISIDDFVFTDLSQKENVVLHDSDTENNNHKTYQRYTGVYLLYYFNTSAGKGKEATDKSASLRYGVMCIHELPSLAGYSEYRVNAILGFTRELAEVAFTKTQEYCTDTASDNYSEVLTYLNTFDKNQIYEGSFELSPNHAFINLHCHDKDRASIILHNPSGTANKYIGGLGTVNSASKGRASSPCIQYIALSRYNLPVSEEEIAAQLMLEYPAVKANSEIDSLVALTKQLYANDASISSPYPQLTEDDKYWMLKRNMETLISELIERSLFRYKQISQDNDDKWYHFIKQFITQ